MFKFPHLARPPKIAVIALLALSGTALAFLAWQEYTTREEQQQFGKRTKGNASILEGIGIDTPFYEDNLTGAIKFADDEGATTSITLKSGLKAYLVVPRQTSFASYVELSEFSELPTSQEQIPVYTTYGYGLNIYIEDADRMSNPLFLVWDFSNGARLEEFKRAGGKYWNRCNYTTASFDPEICASLLKIPAEKTVNTKYMAVSSFFGSDGSRLILPVYSYYLAEDLLVNQIWNSDVIIPQPVTDELVQDIADQSDFPPDGAAEEILDLMDDLSLTFSEPRDFSLVILNRTYDLFLADFKALAAGRSLEGLLQDAIKKAPDEYLKGDLERNLSEIREKIEDIGGLIFRNWDETITSNDSDAAQLRRAMDSNLAGASDFALSSLKKMMEFLDKSKGWEFESRIFYALGAIAILTGQANYLIESPASFSGKVFAGWETEGLPRGPEARQNAKDRVQEVNLDPAASIQELEDAIALIDLYKIGSDSDMQGYRERLEERLRKLVEEEAEEAKKKSDREKVKAAQKCMHYWQEDPSCKDITDPEALGSAILRSMGTKLCGVTDIGVSGLRVLAPTVKKVCKELYPEIDF
ncbi:hypothetical protein A2890_01775 [candidate division WWE3 bacterium RIFCSPLOWO2_01_FULL_53_14]|uniref:Uncharacterized protein n=1 Tax=candidate division WWE3 bacterium RIFCSPLOWO2_01_FULL_53_14 TaxID=1802628 RepID=A0A1F4VT58_UNCKA|nr:MAG: hypothetical protein A2890_01775 [candidate division WWE3 bacterium RIFCSPLOWO2_01_FULL_53_14]